MEWFKHPGRSLTYIRERSGPNMELWGTPHLMYWGLDGTPSTNHCCFLFERYDCSKSNSTNLVLNLEYHNMIGSEELFRGQRYQRPVLNRWWPRHWLYPLSLNHKSLFSCLRRRKLLTQIGNELEQGNNWFFNDHAESYFHHVVLCSALDLFAFLLNINGFSEGCYRRRDRSHQDSKIAKIANVSASYSNQKHGG